MVHRDPVARARDIDFEFIAQGPVRVQGDDAVGQNNRLVHVVGDQNTGLFVVIPNRLNLIRKIGTGQRIKRGQGFIE